MQAPNSHWTELEIPWHPPPPAAAPTVVGEAGGGGGWWVGSKYAPLALPETLKHKNKLLEFSFLIENLPKQSFSDTNA